MRSRVARNCGFAGMGDLGCAVDYHVLSSYTDFQLQFAISLRYRDKRPWKSLDFCANRKTFQLFS